ncbi:MAG: amidohydrolase family protein [Candidatus Doudnabacteria bacterium]|nr:amidohydrolase family protein [Candidatus Doudnabacteria bacterium]
MFDVLIKNAFVLDGSGKPMVKKDLGLKDGKIEAIESRLDPGKGTRVLDAQDKYVSPGFIDIQNHSDSYWTLFDQPEQLSLLSQGITSIIIGNCGSSLAPLPTADSIKTIQKWHNLAGLNINWASFEEFLTSLKNIKLGVNVGSLVGHANLRRGLIGDQVRAVSSEEEKVMNQLLSEALRQGALGLSLGLIYAHEVDSSFDELVALAKTLKTPKKYLSVHLRSETGKILDALDEALALARKAEVGLKISHLKLRGRINWHLFDEIINKLENAYHQGLDISFDVYPYDSSWSVLYTYLPKWAYEGGRNQTLRRIKSGIERRKIIDYLKDQEYEYDKIIVANSESNLGFVGKSITKVAENQGTSNEEAILNVITANSGQAIVFDHNLSQEQVEMFMSSPLSLIATDGAGYSISQFENLVHPRCFGTMPRFLRLVGEKKILPWEYAIKKITAEPARILGLTDRGMIAKGLKADLVIFDPKVVTDRANYEHPHQLSDGIETVIVNGKISLQDKEVLTLSGKVISR